jgi:hypothetical protein
MSNVYLFARPTLRYSATQQIKPRLNPGDGFEGLPASPIWF